MAPPAAVAQPYRVFLMPALHRRFGHATVYTWLLCYAIAIWMGDWDSYLWAWFPIGPITIRLLLLYIPALLVYFIRLGQWHVGKRNTESPADTFGKYALSARSFTTILMYSLSAFFYGEIYIWSRDSTSDLNFFKDEVLSERVRLNERPFYLRFLFFALGIGQGIIHIWKDYDLVRINVKDQQAQKDPKFELWNSLVPMATKAGLRTLVTFVVGNVIYFVGARSWLWSWYFSFWKIFSSIGKKSSPTGLPPFLNLILMFASQGALLVLLWQFTNKAFDVYMAQEPLNKIGKPITADAKDPNGSLLNGLKSKKDDNKNNAFWELAIITARFDDRRKTIYGEPDRKKAPTYKQVTDICLAELRAVTDRINAVTDPNYRAANEQEKKTNDATPIQLVPQIAQPLRDGQITAPGQPIESRLQKIENVTSQIARTHSSPQNLQKSLAKKGLDRVQQEANDGRNKITSQWEDYKNKLARSPIGYLVRHSLPRTASVVVFGTPYARHSIILNSITILTNLSVCSLKEDAWGNYQNVVPDIVRVFVSAITKIESYMGGLQVHWTDVDTLAKPEGERRKVAEVEEVVGELKAGLEKILRAFGEYLEGLNMSAREVVAAKKLVAREVPEMRQAR